ncbi:MULTISPECIES: TetR/AcrR family transcriptional regulator [Sphingobacterium]|jgi:TetR/AcrR family transcriptional repressor of nem operon|uniref:TetR/AcrR family transcriptional regulator n=1 Tax=Sphingobacterium TaxID=28453 RepID=UPI00038A52E4|nr:MULTISPECIES: TetR/AcrR family transcriptional regulator [Sphingobacterium]KKX52154.1 TetR family transcriptional regulator [Sphingobacterium sp. IITKGP-BTPF85]MCW2259150.1 TetR/AcrR family transcriptional repressor of nem operon [Sphingobacterium kitahiroshimense]NJI72757.1 TetR/AcrR family transcriptional regulator [Sphingobacterium sp. B16(2022)]TCR14399.1 TetR family transcriptional regulator [Sphingobacterium sp. JUb78]
MARNIEFDEQLAVSKAMDVFWKKGYNGTTMRDLTEAMGINSSSLYNTIGDKHELFVRSIKHYTESRMKAAVKQLEIIKSPLKAIEKFIQSSVYAITNDPNSCLAIKTTFEVATHDEQVQKVIKADNDFTYNLLYNLVKKAIDSGEIRIHQDAAMLTDYIINHFSGWHESFIIHKDKTRIKNMATFLIKQISQ